MRCCYGNIGKSFGYDCLLFLWSLSGIKLWQRRQMSHPSSCISTCFVKHNRIPLKYSTMRRSVRRRTCESSKADVPGTDSPRGNAMSHEIWMYETWRNLYSVFSSTDWYQCDDSSRRRIPAGSVEARSSASISKTWPLLVLFSAACLKWSRAVWPLRLSIWGYRLPRICINSTTREFEVPSYTHLGCKQ